MLRTSSLSLIALVIALPPLAAAPRLYWAVPDQTGPVVDVIDHPESGALLEKHDVAACAYGECPVAADDPLVGPDWKVGAELSVVTEKGVRRLAQRSFSVRGGASEQHFLVRLAPSADVGEGALVLAAGTAPAADAVLRPVTRRDLGTKEGRRALARLRRELLAKVPPKERKSVTRHLRVTPETVAWVEGRFGGEGLGVVFVTASVPDSIPDEYVTALALADRSGRVQRWLDLPSVGIEHDEPRLVVDVDGDGVEEVLFERSYYEGSYRKVLFRDGAMWRQAILTGDGA